MRCNRGLSEASFIYLFIFAFLWALFAKCCLSTLEELGPYQDVA